MQTGWKTTEAWITALVAWLAIDLVQKPDVSENVQIAGVIGGSVVAASYIASRTVLKINGISDEPQQEG
jgi:hypothetical protein